MIEIIPNWHPLFVHFTVALLSLSVVFFILEKPLHETEYGDNFLVFARYCLWLGVLISVITVLAGWDAYNTVDHDTPSHTAMTEHRNFALVTFGLFVIAAIWLAASSTLRQGASWIFIVYMLIASGLLMVTGNKGAELVYYYGLGVESLPKSDDHGHAPGQAHDHAHGTEAEHGHSEEAEHAHDDSHAHNDAHSHSDAAPADMSMDDISMPAETLSTDTKMEPAQAQEPVVETDEDGISRQELLPELPPGEPMTETTVPPGHEGHDHAH